MSIQIVFETHSTSDDNERGVASGWQHSQLSEAGRHQAAELGGRRRHEHIAAVFTSDLRRARETAEIAFGATSVPILIDWRLRECDYGTRSGMPRAELHGSRRAHIEQPYPGGESWRQAVQRVGRFFADLPPRWGDARVLVIGHIATRWACEHYLSGVPLEDLVGEAFGWRPGWEYVLL